VEIVDENRGRKVSEKLEITSVISEFVHKTDIGSLPARAMDTAKLTFLDTIAVSVGASGFEIGRILGRFRKTLQESQEITVLGQPEGASVLTAAWVNGTFANQLDFDEGYHLGTHTIPAALAVGEEIGAKGLSVLEAYVIGREVGAKLTDVIDAQRSKGIGPTHRGWWHVGIVGPIAAAMTAGKLLKLNVDELNRAVGIASCRSGGFRQNMGTMAKALHSGSAAREGILAAMLAREGVTAEESILETPLGLVRALCNEGEEDWTPITSRLGKPYDLDETAKIKTYPTCTPIHPELDAMLRIREMVQSEGLRDGTEIDSIHANLHLFSMLRTQARDECEAGFCSPYLLAAAYLDGYVNLDTLAEEKLRDPRIRNLMERVHNREDVPSVSVVFRDGRVLEEPVTSLRRLISQEDVSEKARQCMGNVLESSAIDEIIERAMNFESEGDVHGFLSLATRLIQ